jgi:ribosomal protein S8E
LNEFAEKTLREKGKLNPDLSVRSEERAFSDSPDQDDELKKLSSLIAEKRGDFEKTRVKVFKALSKTPGESTCDFASVEAILDNLTPEQIEKLRAGILKKGVLVLTDGGSSDYQRLHRARARAKELGIVLKAVGIIGAGEAEDRQYFNMSWGKDGKICEKPGDLPEVTAELWMEMFSNINEPIK